MAGQLKRRLPRKTKCAVLCEQEVNAGIGILSLLCAGMVVIPVSGRYGQGHVNSVLEKTKPDVIITDQETPQDERFTYIINEDSFRQLREPLPEDILSDVVLLMCTSGTLGKPKAAMITDEGLAANITDIADYFRVNDTDRFLITRPLYHGAVLTGEFLTALYHGADIFFYSNDYNPRRSIEKIDQHQITVLCGTPTMFGQLAALTERIRPEIQLGKIVISGECLTSETARRIRARFANTKIYHVYGLTEASPRVSYLPPEWFERTPLSVGKSLRSVSVKIIDENDNEAAPFALGQLWVKGTNVMKGYYRDQKLTDAVLKGGWLYTGDIACVNQEGHLFIKGRADDMIHKAGMNIYPAEIENALVRSEEIQSVHVYKAMLSDRQLICADIRPICPTVTKRELFLECERLLPAYQLPDKITIVKRLGENASGKTVAHNENRT